MSSKIQSFLARHIVFTLHELVAFLDADAPRNTRTRESLLAHYIRTGRILRIRRGLYASILPGTASVASSIDPYLLAGKMTDDAVLPTTPPLSAKCATIDLEKVVYFF